MSGQRMTPSSSTSDETAGAGATEIDATIMVAIQGFETQVAAIEREIQKSLVNGRSVGGEEVREREQHIAGIHNLKRMHAT